jgi:polysaccharide export outer membrane protein
MRRAVNARVVWSLLAAAMALLPDQSAAQDVASKPATAERYKSARSDYRIGPGDQLLIEVTGIAAETVRVSNSGKVHLSMLGIVRVADRTPEELEAEVARLLVERQLLRQPWVSVRVTDYLSQPVYILGEVEVAGQYAIKGEMYLGDLIALANGPTDNASPVVYLYRRKQSQPNASLDDSPTEEALEIDLHALNEGRNPEQNVRLRGGDVLYIPNAIDDFFFLIGDIKQAGRYKLRREGLTVSRALVQGGGPLRTAQLKKGVLVRTDETGAHQEVPLDLEAILRGRQPDVKIQTGDIIYVPGSTSKSFAYAMTAVVPGVIGAGINRVQAR